MKEEMILICLLELVREEIIFSDLGHGSDKPEGEQERYDTLQLSYEWLNAKIKEIQKETVQ